MTTRLSQRAPGASLETLAGEPDRCALFAHRNLTVGVWLGQADLAAAQATERAARIMEARHPAGRSYVAFILDGLPAPTPDATDLFTKLMGQHDSLACIAYVMEGSGFWASGLRGMINNAYRESGAEGRLRIGTCVEEIADWLSQSHEKATSVAIPAEELRAVLLQARQQATSTTKASTG